MRSDLIYKAVETVENRYMLCQLASKATRKFHKPNTRVQETMNDVLSRVGTAHQPHGMIGNKEDIIEELPQRRAA